MPNMNIIVQLYALIFVIIIIIFLFSLLLYSLVGFY